MDGQPYRIKEYYLFQIQTNYNKITCDSKNLNIKYMIDEVTILKTVHIYCSRHYTYLAFPKWIFTGIHLYAKGQSRVRHAWYALFSSVAPFSIQASKKGESNLSLLSSIKGESNLSMLSSIKGESNFYQGTLLQWRL